MHDCQRFREDWIGGSSEEAGDCQACRSFCEDAQMILQAIDGAAPPIPELHEAYWNGFDDRLRARLLRENALRTRRFCLQWSAVATVAAAIALVMTWGGLRMSQPVDEAMATAPQVEFVDDHIQGLNPTVVTFLGQSELFLRSFTKIDPSYEEDVEDAQFQAKENLAEIERQKLRAADFAPVQMALDEYESFLRDIKNLDSVNDIGDIQTRIQSSGLIANMTAFQPQMILVSDR
jgi:hypothetical protein